MASDGVHLKYDVTIRQQPEHARISAMKISDRRPVDPPMIVQLSVTDPRDIGGPNAPPSRTPHPILARHSHLTNPYYFMYAALVETHNDNEVKYVSDGGSPSTSGALVSSVRVLKDYPNSEQDAAFFIFPNICVRLEGSWRFKLSLFVIDGDKVKLCATTYSAPFFVYQGKQYPGVQASSPLARALAAQGVKLRIRNDPRKNLARPKEEEPLEGGYIETRESTSSASSPDSTPSRSPPKRRRTLMSPVGGLHSFDSPAPTDISNAARIPRQQPWHAPSAFYPSEKMSQYDAHLRRASLDTTTLQRPYPNREWLTPRVLEEYQPNLSPSFTLSSKPEPEYPQWGLTRPAHPFPEADHALFHRQMSAQDSERPVFSWGSSAGSRSFFSPSPATSPDSDSTQEQYSPSTPFWQMHDVPAARPTFEQQVNAQRPTWAGRAIYGPTQ
ncbi:velvet factor-domain-containing protein [Mycena capillaripes]|nr:velvet factor-domain-containing protein [Mycena capillaripes]